MSKKLTNADSGIKIADIGYDVLPSRSTSVSLNKISAWHVYEWLIIIF